MHVEVRGIHFTGSRRTAPTPATKLTQPGRSDSCCIDTVPWLADTRESGNGASTHNTGRRRLKVHRDRPGQKTNLRCNRIIPSRFQAPGTPALQPCRVAVSERAHGRMTRTVDCPARCMTAASHVGIRRPSSQLMSPPLPDWYGRRLHDFGGTAAAGHTLASATAIQRGRSGIV